MPGERGARQIFITGATGHMGRHLIPELVRAGHHVRALVRPGSESKAPAGCAVTVGDALDANSYAHQVAPADTLVHLVGVSHPNPLKPEEFRAIDFKSVEAALGAARSAGVGHFVYLSVAQPAPVMKAYIQVRADGEALIRASGLNATFLRPWYVLGPGRRWPVVLRPLYWLFEHAPATRESAHRLGLVTIEQMVGALCYAVQNPPQGIQIIDVPRIRQLGPHAR